MAKTIITSLQRLLTCAGISAIATMLSCTSLSNSVFAFTLANVIGYNESRIQVVPADQSVENESGGYCNAFGIYMKDLLVRNMLGNVIRETTVGSQVMLEATLVNSCVDQHSHLSIALFEVRDARGITIYLTWQNSTIDSKQNIITGASWVAPDVPGEYTVRSFYVASLRNPMILSNVHEYTLTVLPR